MKNSHFGKITSLLCLAFWAGFAGIASAQSSFAVTTPDFIYDVNGLPATGAPGFFVQNSPTLSLVAGNTYTFNINASSLHPMVIVTNSSGNPSPSSYEYSNASPQIVSSGTITLTIPAVNFPSTLYYQCDFHGFYGVINVLPPQSPAPPPNRIISLLVSTNVVVLSTGTNTTYTLVPQFSSNLVSGAWLPVPGYTNIFANGTNTTTFDRLDAICGPNVYLRISQQPPH
jgi:hypothetical protein